MKTVLLSVVLALSLSTPAHANKLTDSLKSAGSAVGAKMKRFAMVGKHVVLFPIYTGSCAMAGGVLGVAGGAGLGYLKWALKVDSDNQN